MESARATSWVPSPWFLVTPPGRSGHAIDRPRVTALVDDVVLRHRVTVVVAPAGFGKTTALADWARGRPEAVAWLSLTRFDEHGGRLVHGVVSALRRLAREAGDLRYAPLLTLGPDPRDRDTGHAAVVGALEAVPGPTVIVVDDAHLAGADLATSVVGLLAAHAPASVHLVLAGREPPELPLQRVRLAGELGELGPDDLAFTVDEVRVASVALRRAVDPGTAAALRERTDGWPAAVRLALVSVPVPARTAAPAGGPADEAAASLADYVSEEILDVLRPDLADFVLATTVCRTLDAGVAAALSGQHAAGALLEECRRDGLFLDRFTDDGREPVYRWHEVFADRCRAVLAGRDPERLDALHRTAARELAPTDPLRAVLHASRGHDPALALALIEEHWLPLVLRDEAVAVERLCLALPAPWCDTPSALLVRACCRDVLHDRTTAATLFVRAQAEAVRAGAVDAPGFVAARAIAALFLADGYAELVAACDRVAALLRGASGWAPRMHACVTFLLGWTELRLRRTPGAAVEILRTAEWECRTTGQETVRRRAAANLGFALAFAGALHEARAVLGSAVPAGDAGWPSADDGVEWLAEGYVAYWHDDLEQAQRSLRRASACSGDPESYAALARVYLAFTAAAGGDEDARTAAEAGLRDVADAEAHGVPWHVYRRVARATLALASGRPELARAVLRGTGDAATVPVSAVLAAEVLRRAGDRDGALRRLAGLPGPGTAAPVAASALLTRALAVHADGPPPALHAALEEALAAAAPERVVRPFAEPDPLLDEVLTDHLAWGTRHEEFVRTCLHHRAAAATRRTQGGALATLSPREREVLEYLRTPMTVEDIAGAMFVSVNTVKTHLRAVYRKLGVSSRRDAVRAVR